jgi:hypothetical protein
MRPDTDPDFVAFLGDERKADPVSYDSEYGAEFRCDIESFTSLELEAVMVTGRSMLTYQEGVAHWAFIDTAGGGGQDSVALCITRREKDRAVVCRVDEWKPPFAAPAVAVEVVGVLQEYNLTTVTGDAFSGQTWPSVLKDAGLASYVVADKSKSDIFHDFLPLLNGRWNSWTARREPSRKERSVSYLPWRERCRACLLARKTPSEAGKVVAMPKRQAVSPRTLNHLRPRGRVEAL